MSMSMVGEVVGQYGQLFGGRDFKAKAATAPSTLISKPKMNWDSPSNFIGFILFTDFGNFWAPPTAQVTPTDLATDSAGKRTFETHAVTFRRDFNILNVLAVDHQSQIIVAPINRRFPIKVNANEPTKFEFDVPYYVRGNRKSRYDAGEIQLPGTV